MKKETLKKFRNEVYQNENNAINKWLNKKHKKAIEFIDKLLDKGIEIDSININDWNCNLNPSVYLGIRRYSRLAKNDYKLALRYWKIK